MRMDFCDPGKKNEAFGFRRARVAAISMKPRKWKKEENAERLEKMFQQAAEAGAELVVAPEGILEGYVVMDVIEHPEKAPAMLAIAERVNGPLIQRFRSLARKLHICLAFGFAERIRNEVYNAAVFIDATGRLRGKHHKIQFAEGNHDAWYFNRPGKRVRAFHTPFGRTGFLICNERWNPLLARTLVMDGARMLIVPAFGTRKRAHTAALLARARENGVTIISANVGVNLIISKGEITAYHWGANAITMGEIEIPEPPAKTLAREGERRFLHSRQRLYSECLKNALKRYGRDCIKTTK